MLKNVIISQWEWVEPAVQPLAVNRSSGRQALWTVLTLAMIVACMATITGLLGRYSELLELSSHFRWQYCLFLLLAAILFRLGGRRRPALVAGLFGLVNLALIAPLYISAASPTLLADTHRVLMLNVHARNDNYEGVAALINAADPDFFVLVEFTKAWRRGLQSVETNYPYILEAPGKGETVLYSRFPFSVVETPVAEYRKRPPVVATLDAAGQPITVIGAHPNSPRSLSRIALRNQQMATLADVAGGQPGPLLLAGDLNVTPWSPFFHDFLAAAGLRNGRHGFGTQPSWPAPLSILGIPIDHVLVSPEITIHNFETGPYVGSDHYPIIVDFSIHSQSQLAQR